MSNPLKKPADKANAMTRKGEYTENLTRSRIAVAALLAALGGSALAQQQSVPSASVLESEEAEVRRYAVELIVFEYAGDAADTTEGFAPDLPIEPLNDGFLLDESVSLDSGPVFGDPVAALPAADIADEATSTADLPTEIDAESDDSEEFALMPGETLELVETYEQAGIRFTDPADYELTAAYARLDRLDAYRPLMHTRWIQPGVEQELSAALELRRIGDPPLRLGGTVSLYLGRFLHLDLDLELEEKVLLDPLPPRDPDTYFGDRGRDDGMRYGSAPSSASVFYRIREDRIMRNNEVRYFDHPKFGVIAKVVRIEEEQPEAADTTVDLLPGSTVR